MNALDKGFLSKGWFLLIGVSCFLLAACRQDPPSLQEIRRSLRHGLELPGEIYGGSPSFDSYIAYSVFKNGDLDCFVIDLAEKDGLREIDIGELTENSPFLIYLDRNENWRIMNEIYHIVRQNNEYYFYVAHGEENQPSVVAYLGIKIRNPDDFDSVLYITLASDGSLEVKDAEGTIRKFSGADDPRFREESYEFMHQDNLSAGVFLYAVEDVSVGNYLEAYGHIGYTHYDVFLEKPPSPAHPTQ